jgi:lysophospholipase L1-like esterase
VPSRSRTIRSAVVALALAGTVALGITSAAASPRRGVEYDALGDSYASGYGVPPYEACGRSQDGAYPVLLDGRKQIRLDDFVACAGATTASLVAGGQLEALDAGTDLVTVTIGGNDTGWSSAVVACLGGTDEQCAAATAAVRDRITVLLPGRLDALYAQVAGRAPHARVVVTGYARLFSPEYGPFLAASVAEQQALNDGADLLNRVVATAAREHGFRFADVTKRFLGHGVNAPDPWILGPFDPGAFHPDADGYRAYAAAVTVAIAKPARHR